MHSINKADHSRHVPVLIKEVLELLRPEKGMKGVDLTFGEGGHTDALLTAGVTSMVGSDRDSEALDRYRGKGLFASDPRLELVHATFAEFAERAENEQRTFDLMLLDLGISSLQLREPARGFAFMSEGPLDMRLDRSRGATVLEWLDGVDVETLSNLLYELGEVRSANRAASKILEAHSRGELKTTKDLADLFGPARGPRHPATQIFMALRMAVNDELGQIERAIPRLVDRLNPGGRMAVITFHSIEDRLVKRIFKQLGGRCICQHAPCLCNPMQTVEWVNKKAISAARDEVRMNARSRSAKLRCVEKMVK